MNSDTEHLIALVDADNFYVSCERIFRPDLCKRPVVVLSNNDGCVVARSQEVKDLGVKMGTPYFQIRELARRKGITAFSSNYELYGDISARVMQVLQTFSATVEPYSIDEAFLELNHKNIDTVCRQIIAVCRSWLGIPVKIGVSRTKTLAKVAGQLVKQQRTECRYRILTDDTGIEKALAAIRLEDVWGVGRRTADKLERSGIRTPNELGALSASHVKKTYGVVLARTTMELSGIKCFDIETNPAPRQNICCSRSFARLITDYDDLLESVVAYASEAALKLRRQKRKAQSVSVFVLTDRFNRDAPQYANSACLPLPLATNDTTSIVKIATKVVKKIFRPGFGYKKSGVLLNDLVSETVEQGDLFIARDPADSAISKALDSINARYGAKTVTVGVAGLKTTRNWEMSRRHQSPKYTTRWADIVRVC